MNEALFNAVDEFLKELVKNGKLHGMNRFDTGEPFALTWAGLNNGWDRIVAYVAYDNTKLIIEKPFGRGVIMSFNISDILSRKVK